MQASSFWQIPLKITLLQIQLNFQKYLNGLQRILSKKEA